METVNNCSLRIGGMCVCKCVYECESRCECVTVFT